jgi:hypothetical protein
VRPAITQYLNPPFRACTPYDGPVAEPIAADAPGYLTKANGSPALPARAIDSEAAAVLLAPSAKFPIA